MKTDIYGFTNAEHDCADNIRERQIAEDVKNEIQTTMNLRQKLERLDWLPGAAATIGAIIAVPLILGFIIYEVCKSEPSYPPLDESRADEASPTGFMGGNSAAPVRSGP